MAASPRSNAGLTSPPSAPRGSPPATQRAAAAPRLGQGSALLGMTLASLRSPPEQRPTAEPHTPWGLAALLDRQPPDLADPLAAWGQGPRARDTCLGFPGQQPPDGAAQPEPTVTRGQPPDLADPLAAWGWGPLPRARAVEGPRPADPGFNGQQPSDGAAQPELVPAWGGSATRLAAPPAPPPAPRWAERRSEQSRAFSRAASLMVSATSATVRAEAAEAQLLRGGGPAAAAGSAARQAAQATLQQAQTERTAAAEELRTAYLEVRLLGGVLAART